LTFDGKNSNAAWTPDGKRVSYFSTVRAKNGIYSVAADGSGQPELVLATEAAPSTMSWTPDGKSLVYSDFGGDTRSDIWILNGTGPDAQRRAFLQTPFSETNPQVSPDGHWLAYHSNESGRSEVYVQPFPAGGAKVQISTQGGAQPKWARG